MLIKVYISRVLTLVAIFDSNEIPLRTLDLAIYLLTGFCVIATLIPLLAHHKWWVRIFDFPHAQLTFLTFVSLVLAVTLLPWSFLNSAVVIALLSGLVYQCYILYPYTTLANKEVMQKSGKGIGLKLLAGNVFMENREVESCLEVISELDPDIVLLVETDQWWQQQTRPLSKKYPHQVAVPQDNTYGMLLFSKYEFIENEVLYLVEKDVPSIHAKVAISSELTIQLHCLHPAPPGPTQNDTTIERDAELMVVAKTVKTGEIPTIVMGDLNDVAWSFNTRLFQKVSGLLDPRKGRGFFNTFHANYPFLRWPLDHIFHSSHFKLSRISRLPNIGSDHFPIFAELEYDPAATKQQPVPSAGGHEEKQARQKILKGIG